jgi:hypothetical protein
MSLRMKKSWEWGSMMSLADMGFKMSTNAYMLVVLLFFIVQIALWRINKIEDLFYFPNGSGLLVVLFGIVLALIWPFSLISLLVFGAAWLFYKVASRITDTLYLKLKEKYNIKIKK